MSPPAVGSTDGALAAACAAAAAPAAPAQKPKAAAARLPVDRFLDLLLGPAQTGLRGRTGTAEAIPVLAPCLDVRSPAEFARGHVSGAINVPLFSNDERAVVGTTYARDGRFEAIRTGLGFVGPRLPTLLDALVSRGVQPGSRVLVYCWRGGMRSGSVSWLLSLCGYDVGVLEGGYRSFRQWCGGLVGDGAAASVAETLRPVSPAVLAGLTAVGKTAVLRALQSRGEQVLDLEGIANVCGSALRCLQLEPQPSAEALENEVAVRLRAVDPARPLWLEQLSGQTVGQCRLPCGLVHWLRQAQRSGAATVVELSADVDLRLRRFVDGYFSEARLGSDGALEALRSHFDRKTRGNVAKKLGGQREKEALAHIDAGRWPELARLLLDYYDRAHPVAIGGDAGTANAKRRGAASMPGEEERKYDEAPADEAAASRLLRVACPTADAAANAALVLRAISGGRLEADAGDGAAADGESGTVEATTATVDGAVVVDALGAGAASADPPGAAVAAAGKAGRERCSPGGSVEAADSAGQRRNGRCHCGAVRIAVEGKPRAVSYCHCSICRSLSGAPFSCQALFGADQVKVEVDGAGGDVAALQALKTSREVTRQRCPRCLAPVRAELFGGRLLAVPLGLIAAEARRQDAAGAGGSQLDDAFRPQHHLYYDDRIIDVSDDLPKYPGAARGRGR
eukprot:TRINITY_DN18590_c0_g1_i1.p1 TRINITY_DN18590_c0_g1~~TRINITY_DN18590_c0_g1_i1.p1  ORF type:complete len:682 (+),score=181.93 TRINITY_DN18590_c0_g1_i1:49-2094(+)